MTRKIYTDETEWQNYLDELFSPDEPVPAPFSSGQGYVVTRKQLELMKQEAPR